MDIQAKGLDYRALNEAIRTAGPVIFGGDYWTRTSGLMRVKIR